MGFLCFDMRFTGCKGDFAMGDMLSKEGFARIEPLFPLPRGVAPVDDCKVISGIIHVIRNGLRRRDMTGLPALQVFRVFQRMSQCCQPSGTQSPVNRAMIA